MDDGWVLCCWASSARLMFPPVVCSIIVPPRLRVEGFPRAALSAIIGGGPAPRPLAIRRRNRRPEPRHTVPSQYQLGGPPMRHGRAGHGHAVRQRPGPARPVTGDGHPAAGPEPHPRFPSVPGSVAGRTAASPPLCLRRMTMELRHLRCFLAIAEQGTLTRAATRLQLTQPVVSRTLRQLEDHLGARLVDRSTHHLGLTAAGHAFRIRAASAVAAADAAFDPAQLGVWPLRLGHAWSAFGEFTVSLLRSWMQE